MASGWIPWLAAIGIVAVAMLVLVVAAVLIPKTARAVRREFYCPWRSRNVMVRFLSGPRGEPVRVLSCTAFADPLIVCCEQQCVDGVPAAPSPVSSGA